MKYIHLILTVAILIFAVLLLNEVGSQQTEINSLQTKVGSLTSQTATETSLVRSVNAQVGTPQTAPTITFPQYNCQGSMTPLSDGTNPNAITIVCSPH